MTPREKKLGFVLLLAMVVAAGDFLYSMAADAENSSKTVNRRQQARDAVAKVATELAALPLDEDDRAKFKMMQKPLTRDPLVLPPVEALEIEADFQLKPVVCSGYIEMGRSRWVIVNGQEYALGEQIPETGEIVREIAVDGVVLWQEKNDVERRIPYTVSDGLQ